MPSTDPQTDPSRARRHAVKRRVDALVLARIDRLIGLDVRITFAVAVRVQHEHGPALRHLLVLRLEVDPRVEPAFHRAAAGEPEHVLVVEVQVMRTEAGVDGDHFFRLRVVHLHLTAALIDRERLCRRVVRALAAERRCLIRPDARCHPDASLPVHRETVGGRLARPDRLRLPNTATAAPAVPASLGLRVAHFQLDSSCRVPHGIDCRHVVGALLERAVDRSVRHSPWLRLSDAISSWRYAFGSAQSHIVTTTLRSRPCGRGGADAGSSPLAIRSVQSAYIVSARSRPTCVNRVSMPAPACPDCTRRSHA